MHQVQDSEIVTRTQKQLLSKAMRFKNPARRQWLKAGDVDSYGSGCNRVTVYVLEGSPARGFIIAQRGSVIRLDGHGELQRRWYETSVRGED